MKSSRSAGAPGTVLVVDPDDAIRRSVRKWLESRGFVVLDAADAADAERIVRVYVGPIHLLLVEVSVQNAAGSAIADRLRSMHAESQTVFLSATSQADLVKKRELRVDQHFLRKPFDEEHLVFRIQETLTQSP
jgi:DNA-binding response OmpR family regulator